MLCKSLASTALSEMLLTASVLTQVPNIVCEFCSSNLADKKENSSEGLTDHLDSQKQPSATRPLFAWRSSRLGSGVSQTLIQSAQMLAFADLGSGLSCLSLDQQENAELSTAQQSRDSNNADGTGFFSLAVLENVSGRGV
jgi:hypothetical protein